MATIQEDAELLTVTVEPENQRVLIDMLSGVEGW